MRRATLIAIAAACAAACGKSSLAPSSTVTPTAPPSAGQSPPRLALTKFVAFGDSITWGEDGRDDVSEPLGRVRPLVRVDYPYPSIVQSYLQGRYSGQSISVDNKGCRGESAGGYSGTDSQNTDSGCGVLATDRFHTVVVQGGFQSVLLMEGANDLNGIDGGIRGLTTMVEDAKAHAVTVLLATIPPEQSNPDPVPYDRSQPEYEVNQFNQQVRGLAASERVTLVDVNNAFPSPDVYDLYGLLSRDGLHLLEAGYQLIAETFFTSIETTLELPVVTTSGAHK